VNRSLKERGTIAESYTPGVDAGREVLPHDEETWESGRIAGEEAGGRRRRCHADAGCRIRGWITVTA
jgi:hypothetical protein